VLDPARDGLEQVPGVARARAQRLDLRQAPLMRLRVAADPHSEQWYVRLQVHHISGDNTSREIVTTRLRHFSKGARRSYLSGPLSQPRSTGPGLCPDP